MDNETLDNLKQVVDYATGLKNKIEHLDSVVASCNAEVGFVDIRINYRNQNEISLASVLGSAETFTAFRDSLKAAALVEKERLLVRYKELKIQIQEVK